MDVKLVNIIRTVFLKMANNLTARITLKTDMAVYLTPQTLLVNTNKIMK